MDDENQIVLSKSYIANGVKEEISSAMNYSPGNISFESSNIALEAKNSIFLELCRIYSVLVDKMQTELNVLTNVAEGYKKLDAAFDENASILNLNFDSVVIDPIQISEGDSNESGNSSENGTNEPINPSDENSTSEPGNSSENGSNEPVNPSNENSTSEPGNPSEGDSNEPGNPSEEDSNKGFEVPSSDGTGGPGEEPVLPPDSSND